MSLRVVCARSAAEREELYRFRYRVYVEELGLTSQADHERRELRDALDEVATSLALLDDGMVVGSLRLVVLSDVADSAPLVRRFGLEDALATFGPAAIGTTSRFIVDPRLRSGVAISDLLATAMRIARERGVRLNYGDCSPYLLPFYERLGYRRCGWGFEDPAYGFKLPLVMLVGDGAWLSQVRSPLRHFLGDLAQDETAAAWYRQHYEIETQANGLSPAAAMQMHRIAAVIASRGSPLSEIAPALLSTLMAGSYLLRIRVGERLLRCGDHDESLYLLLAGRLVTDGASVHVHDFLPGEEIRPSLTPGDGAFASGVRSATHAEVLVIPGPLGARARLAGVENIRVSA